MRLFSVVTLKGLTEPLFYLHSLIVSVFLSFSLLQHSGVINTTQLHQLRINDLVQPK